MNIIEITPTIGITLYTCMDSETVTDGLEIDDSDRKQVTIDAAEAADRVFASCLDGEISEGAHSHRDWNGGKHYRALTKQQGLAVHWHTRRPIQSDDCEDPADLDECVTWSEWSHLPIESVPAVIRLGVEAMLDKAADACRAVFDRAELQDRKEQILASVRGRMPISDEMGLEADLAKARTSGELDAIEDALESARAVADEDDLLGQLPPVL